MTRHAGPLLVLLVLLALGAARWSVTRRAEALVSGEAQARATFETLATTARELMARGVPLEGLRGEFAAAVPGLTPLAELGTADITYARDEVYLYGLASRPHRDPVTGELLPGFVLRAWPLRFGVTGDLEFHTDDGGALLLGQNRTGRSGTRRGFPPSFPEPGLGQPGQSPWWPAGSPPHR